MAYLRGFYEPENEAEDLRMKHKTRNYKIINNELYKEGICQPLLKCISTEEGKNLLSEIHEGICAAHAGARATAGKAFRQGFYWPSAQSDSKEVITKCHNCQLSANRERAPGTLLQTIEITWPLARWGIDIIGKLLSAQGNFQYAVVAVEYFTKWIEAKPITNMSSHTMKKFLWQNIICRFGVPRQITVDNGTQFDNQDFREYCNSMGIQLCFASVRHPQSNGAVERANGIICVGISKCLVGLAKGKRVEELPKIIWAHNTSKTRSTNFTPFKLLFGDEAMSPEEIKHEGPRTNVQIITEEDQKTSKDLLEEERNEALNNLKKYQQETRGWYNKKVKARELMPGDFVLKRKRNEGTVGKFQQKWEGPFVITKTSKPGAYHLVNLNGQELDHTWNIETLRRYYP